MADRLGFVVIDEMPAHKDGIKRLIARDKNHASVVMWSIANEAATHQDGARAYFEPILWLV